MGATSATTTKRTTIISKLVHGFTLFLFSLVIFFAISHYITEPSDRSKCHGLLNDGWFQGDNYTNWQAPGCMIHNYKAEEIASCLNHSRVLYVGDSIMREQFFSMNKLTHALDTKGPLHVDRKYISEEYGLVYEFWWDPYINQTRTIDLFKGKDKTGDKPSLLVIGSGIWYERRLPGDTYLDEWKKSVDRVFAGVESHDDIADTIMLSPVELPQFNRLNEVRQRLITLDKTSIMNNYLHQREATLRPKSPFAIAFAWNSIATATVNETNDGLHYLPPVTTPQAQLALNYRCNQQLTKHYPISTTCCITYPAPRWYQSIFFALFLVWVPLAFFLIDASSVLWLRKFFPSNDTQKLTSLFIFGLGVIYMYLGDRTQLFSKIHKDFQLSAFTIQMVVIGVLGLITMVRQRDEDLGFLNRDQTNEWKGWMQLIILVYHFTGASGTPGIYNAVRSLVAAYLFQTGYGHFFFFYKKKDYGMARILNVMVRLNLLTFVLIYLMNTDYLSYYFTPLVSLWFMVIWVTMYIGHHHNSKTWFLLVKMMVMCALTTAMIHVPGVLETSFDILATIANIHWQAAEWRFRLALDAYIVYFGMLFALLTIKMKEHKIIRERDTTSFALLKWITVFAAAMSLIWYFWFELSQPSKQAYNARHPYISWIPILAFVILRNCTLIFRNTNSRFFMWIGSCSLETFIGQFHMWLAADTKGLLVVIPSSWVHRLADDDLGWWLNFIVSSILFLYVCHYLSQSTGTLTSWICHAFTYQPPSTNTSSSFLPNQQGEITPAITRDDDYQAVPLLATGGTLKRGQDGDEEAEKDEDMLSLEEEMNTWQPTPSRYQRRISLIWHDARFKSFLFLLTMTAINHFC